MRGSAPARVGITPHRTLDSAVAVTLIAVAACSNGDAQVTPPVVLGMNDQMAPYYQDQNTTLYESQKPVALPVRRPTDMDMNTLGARVDPYPRGVYLLASDERIEIRWTVSNLDDKEHTVELLVDPWNEFVRYRPGVQVVNDEQTQPNFSGFDKFLVLHGKERISGTFTPDDMHDLAVKLATVMNIVQKTPPPDPNNPSMGPSSVELCNRVMNMQNRTNTGDPLFTPYIPSVIAGITGFDLGLRTLEAANVAVEITVDVTDSNGNKFVQPGSSTPKIDDPPGTVLQPGG